MSDFIELETVVNLFRLGSYSVTAEKMHTTQSNISKRILKIESDLGVTLISKVGRKLKPTPQGEIFLDYARRLLKLREEMLSKIEKPASKKGKIRVGSSETIVFILLSGILKEFRAKYPQIQLDLQVDISKNLKKQLLEEKTDIAFLIGGTGDPDFIDLPLVSYEMGWFVPRSMVKGENLKDILEVVPLITFSRDTAPFNNLVRALREEGIRCSGIHNCASLSTLINMTITDGGVGVFPCEIAKREPWKNQLRELKGLPIPPLDYFVSFLDQPHRTELRQMAEIATAQANKKK